MHRGKESKRNELLQKLQSKIPEDLLSFVPQHWWKIGDILILTIPQQLLKFKEDIGEALLALEQKPLRTVLGKVGPTKGIVRTPSFEFLAGDVNTETIHKELGCKFKIDAAKLTFSPGNHGERERLLKISNENEFIIDMYSCVGNLSLPLAVHKTPKKIIAAEINPLAYKYLTENIILNNVETVMKAVLGDNRVILKEFEGEANRVLSGYLNSDDEQLELAIRLCKENGIIHYHEAVPLVKKEKPIIKIDRILDKVGKDRKQISEKRVKKYSPGVEHIVYDIQI